MKLPRSIPRTLAPVILFCVAASAWAQGQTETFTNLKVLPKDIPPAELRGLMNSFTRALGVRCAYCHVGEEGKPMHHEDFPKDDKPTKLKARIMIQMTQDINEKYLSTLATRSDPPIRVQCATCHRGTTQPRMLQDVLMAAYGQGGLDSTVARYQGLRDRYYGRYTYDFGDVPLGDVGRQLRDGGHAADAAKVLAMNVELNPKSAFAKRQYASVAITEAFRGTGADSGKATYQRFKAEYGPSIVSEEMLNDTGYQLLGSGKNAEAIAAFELNAAEHPTSANAYDSLGEAYATTGDKKRATTAYKKSLELDPTNENAKQKLAELKAPSKKKH
jgi:Flp pilus assembly protein TadD